MAIVHEPDPRASVIRNVAGINLQVVIDALNNATRSPDGFDFGSGDVFPSSVSVARSVAAAFVAARAGSRG